MSRLQLHLLALITLVFLTLLFFWKILLTNLILVGVDTFLYFYPYKAYAAEALRQGRLPLWNPHLFMGAPLLANSQVGVLYPLNWPLIWLSAPKQVAWSIGLHIALAGFLMFLLAQNTLKLKWGGSMIAAILFAMGGYLGAQVEHVNQLNAAAWLPLLVMLYDFGVQRRYQRRWFWFLWLAVIVALSLLAGHAQTTFISLFGLGLYALWFVVSEWFYKQQFNWEFSSNLLQNFRQSLDLLKFYISLKFFRFFLQHLGPLVVISGLAIALAAMQILPTAELSERSIRSGGLTFQEVVSFSLPPTTLHYTLLPPYNVDLTTVWSEAFSEWVAYLGISGGLLVILGGLSSIGQPTARRFVFIAGCGLILSFGLYTGPLYLILYKFAPGFDLFRVPARWLLLYAFGAAALGGFGFDVLFQTEFAKKLGGIWQWLRERWSRSFLFIGAPLLAFVLLLAWHTPPLSTMLLWAGLFLVAIALLSFHFRSSLRSKAIPLLFVLLLLMELFFAAQTLNYNHPTAPQAYHSMRNATAFLLAADPPHSDMGQPPDRFLSLSGIAYDPGDAGDLERIFGDQLDPEAVYDLTVATKQKEVLFFNLPLVYGLHSVDGYDGGILPLNQFLTLQKLLLPSEDDLSMDGRLREKLQFVPPGRLLSLLNTRWIITDKVFDAWIDGIFYDLQFPANLNPKQKVIAQTIPEFSATAAGFVSHIENGHTLPENHPVALITLVYESGKVQTITLLAGQDTAEGAYTADISHPQATIGVPWPYGTEGVDYVSIHPLSQKEQVIEISVESLLDEGVFVLRGISLIHQPTTTSQSVLISTLGDYQQVHSGDVKIYENVATLPRAYLAHQAILVDDEKQAVEIMRDEGFQIDNQLVLIKEGGIQSIFDNEAAESPSDQVSITSYQPERVELSVSLEEQGWLILTDTYYPGWIATVDGQPTQIFKANLNFRAIQLPAGEHQVVFSYEPQSVQLGQVIMIGAMIVVFFGLALTGWRGW